MDSAEILILSNKVSLFSSWGKAPFAQIRCSLFEVALIFSSSPQMEWIQRAGDRSALLCYLTLNWLATISNICFRKISTFSCTKIREKNFRCPPLSFPPNLGCATRSSNFCLSESECDRGPSLRVNTRPFEGLGRRLDQTPDG